MPQGVLLSAWQGDEFSMAPRCFISEAIAARHPIQPDVIPVRTQIPNGLPVRRAMSQGAGRVQNTRHTGWEEAGRLPALLNVHMPLVVGAESALLVEADPMGSVTGDHLLHMVIFFYKFSQPGGRIVDVVIRGADEGVGKAVERGNDLCVGPEILGGANGQPGALQIDHILRQQGHVLVDNPEYGLIGCDGLAQETTEG